MSQSETAIVNYQGQNLTVSIKKRLNASHLVFFLHGLGCAKESFDGAFEAKGLDEYSICTMDFIGFGSSDKLEDFSYKMEDQAAIARQVLEQLAPKTVTVVAHSMGGAIGLLLAQQLPNMDKFIDVEGNLVAEDCGLVSRGTAKQPHEEFEQHGFQEFLSMLTTSDRTDFHEWATWYKQASPRAIHASSQSMVEWSDSGKLLEIFNGLESKTYVYGDEESKDYLLHRFQKANVRYIPKLKHFMMAENPDVFFGTIAEILRAN